MQSRGHAKDSRSYYYHCWLRGGHESGVYQDDGGGDDDEEEEEKRVSLVMVGCSFGFGILPLPFLQNKKSSKNHVLKPNSRLAAVQL